MRYIKEEILYNSNNDPLFSDNGTAMSSAAILLNIISSYDPIPQMGQVLNMQQIRLLNQALDILEASSDDGWYSLEDAHADVITQIINWMIPLGNNLLRRHCDSVLAIVSDAPHSKD